MRAVSIYNMNNLFFIIFCNLLKGCLLKILIVSMSDFLKIPNTQTIKSILRIYLYSIDLSIN